MIGFGIGLIIGGVLTLGFVLWQLSKGFRW